VEIMPVCTSVKCFHDGGWPGFRFWTIEGFDGDACIAKVSYKQPADNDNNYNKFVRRLKKKGYWISHDDHNFIRRTLVFITVVYDSSIETTITGINKYAADEKTQLTKDKAAYDKALWPKAAHDKNIVAPRRGFWGFRGFCSDHQEVLKEAPDMELFSYCQKETILKTETNQSLDIAASELAKYIAEMATSIGTGGVGFPGLSNALKLNLKLKLQNESSEENLYSTKVDEATMTLVVTQIQKTKTVTQVDSCFCLGSNYSLQAEGSVVVLVASNEVAFERLKGYVTTDARYVLLALEEEQEKKKAPTEDIAVETDE